MVCVVVVVTGVGVVVAGVEQVLLLGLVLKRQTRPTLVSTQIWSLEAQSALLAQVWLQPTTVVVAGVQVLEFGLLSKRQALFEQM